MTSTSPRRERLDVESPNDRDTRIGNLLSSLSQTSPSASSPSSTIPLNPNRSDSSRPFAVPQSDVLARARAFLPLLQASNEELLARAAEDPDAVDMEKADGDEKVIAMDLGLGVFDAPQNPTADLGPVIDSIPPQQESDTDSDGDSEDQQAVSAGDRSDSDDDSASSSSSEESSSEARRRGQ